MPTQYWAAVTDGSSTLKVGAVVGDGRFAVTGQLGSGSQGTTYEAIDKRDGRLVALKRFSVRGAASWKDVELAEREAKVLSALHHRNLPRYLAHFEEGGALYLAMEKVEGKTLREMRAERISQADVIHFLNDSAETLNYLHAQAPPIIHRDIKPSNVIRAPDGRFVLVDFGSVRDRLKPEGGSTVVGTFGYMAPEQFQGRAMPATDTYAVGATALSMLAGEDPDQLPHKGLALDVDAALGSHFDARLKRFLTEALEPDPDVRSRHTLRQLLDKHGLHAVETTDTSGARATGVRAPSANAPGGPSANATGATADPARSAATNTSSAAAAGAEILPFQSLAARFWLRRLPVAFVVMWALWIARVCTSVVMTLLVPMLLSILALFFGPGPKRGARQVLLAGRQAQRVLQQTSARVHATARPKRLPRRRRARRKVRVAQTRMQGFERGVEELEREIDQAVEEVERELGTRRR